MDYLGFLFPLLLLDTEFYLRIILESTARLQDQFINLPVLQIFLQHQHISESLTPLYRNIPPLLAITTHTITGRDVPMHYL